ncbi:hypothetical protein CH063_14874, partial [Colletotrichum higginsianum]
RRRRRRRGRRARGGRQARARDDQDAQGGPRVEPVEEVQARVRRGRDLLRGHVAVRAEGRPLPPELPEPERVGGEGGAARRRGAVLGVGAQV